MMSSETDEFRNAWDCISNKHKDLLDTKVEKKYKNLKTLEEENLNKKSNFSKIEETIRSVVEICSFLHGMS
jgi:hypothetical protein